VTKLEELTIKEARDIACLLGSMAKPKTECCVVDGGVRIVVLQRGWVVVGHHYAEGDQVRIEKAAVVRLWGTSLGLGQLATDGPQPNTKLDECPTVRVHALAVVCSFDCAPEKWSCRL
jgi:hypothetical protein